MDIRDLYKGNILQEAFQRLQSMMISPPDSKPQRFLTRIEGPEVVSDSLLSNWLALNYIWAVDFDQEGALIMGKIGGVIPEHPEDGKRVLAVAEASVEKVMYGFDKVKESRKTGDQHLISELEREIEMPLETRGEITLVNGTRNVAHYDFVSEVSRTHPHEVLNTNAYLLFSASGFIVMSNKSLPNEHYILNVPINEEIFKELKKRCSSSHNEKIKLLREARNNLMPAQYIAGFHIFYKGHNVALRPLIPQRDAHVSLEDYGVEISDSPLAYLGTSSPYGELTGIMSDFLEVKV